MAKVIVVDEEDNVLTHKPQEELGPADIFRAATLWITSPEGEILLERRSAGKRHHGGKWSAAVNGHVEQNEEYLDTILREAAEELGLRGIQPVPLRKFFRVEKDRRFFSQWFTALIARDAEFTIDHSEVAEVRWWTREELERAIKEHPEEFVPSAKEWLRVL